MRSRSSHAVADRMAIATSRRRRDQCSAPPRTRRLRGPCVEWVPPSVARRYREQPPFDLGESGW